MPGTEKDSRSSKNKFSTFHFFREINTVVQRFSDTILYCTVVERIDTVQYKGYSI